MTRGTGDGTAHGRVLDLFCGVGGAARGLERLGYETVGFDIEEQPKYPSEFHQRDLSDGLPEWVLEESWAGVWASPSCQFRVGVHAFRSGENLIPLARRLIDQVDAEWRIIENVPGARDELRDPVALDGGAFEGMDIRKRRYFETNFIAQSRISGDESFGFALFDREHPVEGFREAHGFDRDSDLTAKELREAIPPAYVEELVSQYRDGVESVQQVIA